MGDKKIIVFIAVIVLVLFGGAFVLFGLTEKDPKKGAAELEFWNVFDDSDVFKDLIKKFNEEYPKVKITYKKKTFVDYETELVDALAAGRGPDIFAVQNTWLPKHIDKISPIKETSSVGFDAMTVREFKDIFVDVAAQDFVVSSVDEKGNVLPERIYALPLFVDTLALYWNKDFFNSEGIANPPANWEEFMDDAEKLTKRDEVGDIIRAGASLGTIKNINRGGDILMLLMMQHGTEMVDLKGWKAAFNQAVVANGELYKSGLESLRFYTDFANPNKKNYSWNNKMDYSIDAFAEGKSAMMINYSFHIPTIKAKQPYLNFGIAPAPQPKDAKIEVSYSNYWGLTVSNSSSENEIQYSWIFLKWLAQQPQAKEYLEKAQRPASRRDLIGSQQSNLELGVFATQALAARSWYQADNLAVDAVFGEMIDSVIRGEDTVDQAIEQAANEINVLMAKKKKK
jgi:ABC-type glycerol-3-phosphate transport system substrate-binding protein